MEALKVISYVAGHPLNRGARLRSLLRFAKWQVGSRLLNSTVVFDWFEGARFFVRTGETGLTGNIYVGLQEFQDMGYLLHVLRASDVFVDVGANVGSYTILACAVVGASGWAIEPVPAAFGRLVENVRLNHLEGRVRCLNMGAGNAVARARFTSHLDTVNHALAEHENADQFVEVELSTLDLALPGVCPAVIKIDVEGYEWPVLEGAGALLSQRSLHSVIMELNGSGRRYGFEEARILQMMFDHGFRSYSYEPYSRRLLDLEGRHLNEGNTLFIRELALVRSRIDAAPTFKIRDKVF